MNKKETLKKEMEKLSNSPYQGEIAGNSTIKFHKKLFYQSEWIHNVWAIWSGRPEPEFIGSYEETLKKIQELISLETEF